MKISLVENRNPKINIVLIPPLTFTRRNPNCKNPKYAKAHPIQCGDKPEEPVRSFSASERADANFLFNQRQNGKGTHDPNHRNNYKLCYDPVEKKPRWFYTAKSPCLGKP